MSKESQTEALEESSETPRVGQLIRGRIPQPVQEQILAMHRQGMSIASIATVTSRSVASIQKLVDGGTEEDSDVAAPPAAKASASHAPQNAPDLDEVVDFLAQFPDELLDELFEVARLAREQAQLRTRLEHRLSQWPSPAG